MLNYYKWINASAKDIEERSDVWMHKIFVPKNLIPILQS